MSQEVSTDLLRKVVCRMLEEAAFMFCDVEEAAVKWPPKVIVAELTFKGPASGRLRLLATPSFAEEVAANLLAEEPGTAEAKAAAPDAMGELINIVGGAVLAEWFGVEQRTGLGIPTVRETAFLADASATCGVSLVAEGKHRLFVEVVVE